MNRNYIPAVLAVGAGIATGYYTFQPALQQLQSDKPTKAQQDRVSAEKARKEPSAKPVTPDDPSSTPRGSWTERIWGSKKTPTGSSAAAEAAGPSPPDAPGNRTVQGEDER